MNKELITVRRYKKVLFKGMEGNYLICDLVWEPYTTRALMLDGKWKSKKFAPRHNNQKVKIQEGNSKLIEKINTLHKRRNVILLYTLGWQAFRNLEADKYNLDIVTLIDVFTLDEWEERMSRIKDEELKELLGDVPPYMLTSLENREIAREKEKLKRKVQRELSKSKKIEYNTAQKGMDFINSYIEGKIKNSERYKYYHVCKDNFFSSADFFITKEGTPCKLTNTNLDNKLDYEELIKLIKDEEQKGFDTFVYIEK